MPDEGPTSGQGGQPSAELSRGLGGVVGVGDRTHHHDAGGAGGDDLVHGVVIDPADREPGTRGAVSGVGVRGGAHQLEADAGPPRLGGRRPHRTDAEVAEVGLGTGGAQLRAVVGGQAEGDAVAEDPARLRAGEVPLAEMQHGGAGGRRDVGAVVHRPEPAVPLGDLTEDAEELELLGGLEVLVAELDDVDATGVGGVDEGREVSAVAAGIGADVELSIREEHPASVPARCDVVVIGGGVVGLAIAWELVCAGRDVRLIDPEPGSGATHAAAGMIAPISEHRLTEPALHALAEASAAGYPAFLDSVPGGRECGLETADTLLLAVDDADRRALEDLTALHPGAVETLGLREARRLEPLLGPRVIAARRVREQRVDPRALAAALLGALADRVLRVGAAGILHEDPAATGSPVTGVRLADGATIEAEEVVVAAGLGAAQLEGMPFALPLRPVHGDILRLRVPPPLRPFLSSTVRANVRGSKAYLVPRRDGTVVIGATQREHGGRGVSAGGVYELLRDAVAVVPAVSELTLLEATSRARPVTPDNAPLLGRAAPGLIVATGFGRHGVMLAPIAARSVRLLTEGRAAPLIDPFPPDRFVRSPVPVEVP